MTYDGGTNNSLGNIQSKSDIGNYRYDAQKINAVRFITTNSGIPSNPPYVISVNTQAITYTPFLKTATISENGYLLTYTYGEDEQRIKSVLMQGGTTLETKYYLGVFERQMKAGITRDIHYINAGNGLCAIIVKEGGVVTPYFVYSDHLGSLLTATNSSGTIVAEQNFDAWGRYRNPTNWTYNSIPVRPDWLYRGFTGHEHVAQFGLINMNGRMYDPVTCRMLSPDNYVPLPWNTQGYNRYGYANNNPLIYVDQDGEFIHLIIGAIIGGVVNLASGIIQGKIHSFWDGLAYFGVGAAAGALSAGIGAGVNTLMAGGSFSAGFWGTAAGVSSTGFFAGAVTGASAGFANGLITGIGNTALNGGSLGKSLLGGLNNGWKQAVTGGISGGIIGGIDAIGKDVNFFSGKAQMDLSSGYGAHGISTDQTITGKYVGEYKNTGVSVYESKYVTGEQGITLPGRGIIVSNGAFSLNQYPNVLQHEFGHILQAQEVGMVGFYGMIAKESAFSAAMNGHLGWDHRNFWTETWANYLSKEYWGSNYVSSMRFPVQDISWFNWLRLKQFSFLMP